MAAPRFFQQPFRYIKWAANEQPAIFFSLCIAALGPAFVIVVPPIRRRLGYERVPKIPLTYPIPTGPRKPLEGYDDEE